MENDFEDEEEDGSKFGAAVRHWKRNISVREPRDDWRRTQEGIDECSSPLDNSLFFRKKARSSTTIAKMRTGLKPMNV